jgi:hypothetical protein
MTTRRQFLKQTAAAVASLSGLAALWPRKPNVAQALGQPRTVHTTYGFGVRMSKQMYEDTLHPAGLSTFTIKPEGTPIQFDNAYLTSSHNWYLEPPHDHWPKLFTKPRKRVRWNPW